MEDYMKEKYPYNYEFADPSSIKDTQGKYADSIKYRFAILLDFSKHKMHANDALKPDYQKIEVSMFDFYFYDRLTRKTYPITERGSSWASMTFIPMMNTILKKFE
jgi:hypothetical protein